MPYGGFLMWRLGRTGELPARSTRADVVLAAFAILMILAGVMALFAPMRDPTMARASITGILFLAGLAELVIGLSHRRERGAIIYYGLGLTSLAASLYLLLPGPISGSGLSAVVALWFFVRGAIELLGWLAPGADSRIHCGWLLRAAMDLMLGVVTMIGAQNAVWLEIIVGWPFSTLQSMTVMLGIGLIASGVFDLPIPNSVQEKTISDGTPAVE